MSDLLNAIDRLRRAAAEEYVDECCGRYIADMDGEPHCCWQPERVCSVYASDLDAVLDRLAKIEAAIDDMHRYEREGAPLWLDWDAKWDAVVRARHGTD